jgi:endonuclease/exonuclease/phosphatase family metal-dependent hydrolase
LLIKILDTYKKQIQRTFLGAEDRTYVEVRLDVNDTKLKVGTVHLSYSTAFAMTEKKLGEADKLYEAVQDNHEKFILTGDMNAKPDSPIIKS